MLSYNPDKQAVFGSNLSKAIFENHPTLASLRKYGDTIPKAWLLPQLYDLSEYCGCKVKLQERPLEQCAEVISSTWYYLKTSELMAFFFRFKAGMYGQFYGSIDPLKITSALRDFVKERNNEISIAEQARIKRRREEDAKKSISREEWLKLKQQIKEEQ